MDFRRQGLVFAALLEASAALAGSVSGRLLDSGGKPVEGAAVAWFPFRSEEETLLDETTGKEPQALGETKTDAAGRFAARWEKEQGLVTIRVLSAAHLGLLLPGPYDSGDVSLSDIALPSSRRVAGRVVDEAGRPVAGARVEAWALSAAFGFSFAEEGGRFFSRAVTAEDGGFTFASVPHGNLVVLARAAGYVPAEDYGTGRRPALRLKRGAALRGKVTDRRGKPAPGAIVIAGGVAGRTDDSGRYALSAVAPGRVVVRALWREELGGRRAGIRLRKGEVAEVAIRLTEDAAIAGVVSHEKSRRPVVGALVSCSRFSVWEMEEASMRRAITDARGRFRIGGLPRRTFSIEAARRGYQSASAGPVEAATPEARVSLVLSRGAAVVGRVVDEKGSPMAGAEVGVAGRWEEEPRGLTDVGGRFRLDALEPSRNLILEARKRGFVRALSRRLFPAAGAALRDVSLVLRSGLTARGRIVTTLGEGIPGARVHVSPRVPGAGSGFERELWQQRPDAIAGLGGAFSLSGLEEEDYAVRVEADGYGRKTVASLAVVRETPNEWTPIVLGPATAISGTVTARDGRAIPAAIVTLLAGELSLLDRTGEDGRFHMEGLSEGLEVAIYVRAEGYAEANRRVAAPAENLTIRLAKGGILRGWVEDARSREPVSHFFVTLVAGAGLGFYTPRSFESDDGSFELDDIPAGTWRLQATAEGYRVGELSGIEIAEGEVREIPRVLLEAGFSLSGRVLEPSRRSGVANAVVRWETADAAVRGGHLLFDRKETVTDAEGRYQFEGLEPGRITLFVSHPEYPDLTRETHLPGPESLDLVLEAGGSLSGIVVGREGAPIPRVRVSLAEMTEEPFQEARASEASDGAGAFLFAGVPAGHYRIWAEDSAPKEVALSEGEHLDGLIIEMRAGGTLKGRVVGLPPRRLSGLEVSLQSQTVPDPYSDRTATNDIGEFLFRDVPAGTVRIEARTAGASRRSADAVVTTEGSGEQAVEVLFEGDSTLSGRVLRGERPLPGVFVVARPPPFATSRWRALSQTDEEGRFVLEGLDDGEYRVRAFGGGFEYAKNITISGHTEADIALPSGAVRGRVTDDVSGEAIASAVVERGPDPARGESSTRQASTDSNGFYSLETLDPGTCRLIFRKAGYQTQELAVLVGSEVAQANVALQRAVP